MKEFDYLVHVNRRTSPEGIMDMMRYEQARVIAQGACCTLPHHTAPCTLWHLRAPMPPTVARWASFGISTRNDHNPDTNPHWTPLVAKRVYKCADCDHEQVTTTNHTGTVWALRCRGRCRNIINPHTEREIVLPKYGPHFYVREFDEPRPCICTHDASHHAGHAVCSYCDCASFRAKEA